MDTVTPEAILSDDKWGKGIEKQYQIGEGDD